MPGPLFISSQSRFTAATTSTVVPGDMPSGIVIGELLLAHVITKLTAGGVVGQISPPVDGGWELIPETYQSPNTHLRTAVYWKRAVAGMPTSYNWASEFNASSSVVISRYEEAHTQPIHVAAGANSGTTAVATQTAPSVTTTTAEVTLVVVYANGSTSAAVTSAPASGLTRRYLAADIATPGRTIILDDGQISVAGATGNKSITQDFTSIWGAAQIALMPKGAVSDPNPPEAPTGLTATVVAAND